MRILIACAVLSVGTAIFASTLPTSTCCLSTLAMLDGPTTAPATVQEPATPKAESKSKAAFDALTKLAGRWKLANKIDDVTEPRYIEFKVIARGSVVMETMLPGTAMEMVNLYALDGDDLLVTHYCASGNQPRMKLAEWKEGRLTFVFKDATNLASPQSAYMGGLKLTTNDGKLVEDWTHFAGGKEAGAVRFELVRD